MMGETLLFIITILLIALVVIPFLTILIGGPIIIYRFVYESIKAHDIQGVFLGLGMSFVLGIIGLTILHMIGVA